MISCSSYDYVEIVCMFNYPVIITLKTGEAIQGKAMDTVRGENREECIKLGVNGAVVLVVLDTIEKLTVTVENPHFNEVSFI